MIFTAFAVYLQVEIDLTKAMGLRRGAVMVVTRFPLLSNVEIDLTKAMGLRLLNRDVFAITAIYVVEIDLTKAMGLRRKT